MDDPNVHQYVQEKLEPYWSPDQIAGRAKRDFRRTSERWLSDQAIHDWIHQQQPVWKPLLRRGGRPPEKWGKLTDCVRIDGRPEVINGRCRYGDWEGDTMVGHGRHSGLVTLVERKSGYTRIGRVESMKSNRTMRAAKRRLQDLPHYPKGTDFTTVGHRAVARVEQSLNDRPCRRLNYRTPNEVLAKHLCRN